MNDWRLVLPGDVGFVHNEDFNDRWIQFAERRKYGKNAPEARWNHTFLLDSSTTVLEATPNGTARDPLSNYDANDVLLLRPPYASDVARDSAIKAMEELLGERYGWLTVACEALAFLTGTRLRFGISGTSICSGAVSYALTRGGIDVGTDEEWNSPADVASYGFRQHWTPIQTKLPLHVVGVTPT